MCIHSVFSSGLRPLRSANAEALAVVAGFWIVDRCPQVDVQSLLVRFAPPAAEENLRVAKLNAHKAALALATDDVLTDVDHVVGGLSPHTSKARGAVIGFVRRVERHVAWRDFVIGPEVSGSCSLADAKVVHQRSPFHMAVLSQQEINEP